MHSNKRQKEGPEGNHDFCLLNAWFTSWKAWVYLFRTSIFCWPCSPFSTTSHNLSLFYFCIHGSKPENIKSMHILSHLTSRGEGDEWDVENLEKERTLHGRASRHRPKGMWNRKPKINPAQQGSLILRGPLLPKFLQQSCYEIRRGDTFTWLGPHRSYQSARNVKQSFCISYLLPRSLHCSVEGHSLWVSI